MFDEPIYHSVSNIHNIISDFQ